MFPGAHKIGKLPNFHKVKHFRILPYHVESTIPRYIYEVKQRRAHLVL